MRFLLLGLPLQKAEMSVSFRRVVKSCSVWADRTSSFQVNILVGNHEGFTDQAQILVILLACTVIAKIYLDMYFPVVIISDCKKVKMYLNLTSIYF